VPDFRTPKRGPGKKSDKRPEEKFIFLNNMDFQRMGNGGIRAATANVNVYAMVYFIDF
jgi:hypothetical protein